MTSWFRDYAAKGATHHTVTGDDAGDNVKPVSRGPKHRFDFEIGYLVKSPCKRCVKRSQFPGCDEACDTLDKIHGLLCDSVSCTKRR